MTFLRIIRSILASITLLLPSLLAAQVQSEGAAPQPEPVVPPLPVEAIDPAPYLPGLPLWLTLPIVAAVLLPIALLVWFFLSQKQSSFPLGKRKQPPIEAAREELAALHELSEDTPLADLSTKLSLLLRRYLAASKSDSSLYQTREEFLTDEERLRHLQEPVKSETADFLSNLADLQYAPPAASGERLPTLLEDAKTVLEKLHQASLTNERTQESIS